MVEKIVVAPNEVRGYGNIVDNDKDKSDLCFYNSFVNADTDLIDGIRIGIMRMIYQDPNLFFSFHQLEKYLYVNSDDMTLSFDSTNKCLVFDDTTESFSLGFDSTNKVLYIGETGEHNYSIAFSQSSYTASGGSATLEITLLDSNVPVQSASVTVTGSDSSSYTGITNSQGTASIIVTGVTSSVTFNCTYGNVSDTCTVIPSSIPYQTVEYLQSNGSQYINTGYILKANDKVEVTVSMQGSGSYNGVFGARKNDYEHNAYALFGRFGSANKFVYTRTGQEKSGNTISTNVIYDVTTQGSTCTIMQGDTLVQTLTNTGTIEDCVNPCGLFVLNTHNGTDFNKDTYGYMKIYSFKITDSNNNVIMDLVPVRDGSTGYMYDKVSNSLMTNNGTFLYGNDI